MSSPIHRRDSCRLCGGRDLQLVLQLTPTPIGSDYVPAERLNEIQECYPIDLYLCGICGYVGILDVIAPETLFDESSEVTSMSLGVIEDLKQLAVGTVGSLSLPKDSLVVDIGSNDGTLLKSFRDQGMRVVGVEPSRHAANLAIASGISTLNAYFTPDIAQKIKADSGPAQVISANRVLANIDDMTNTIEGIKQLMAPDGVLIFETGYLVDIVENGLFDTIYHEHLGYDTAYPFNAFFQRHGLELLEIDRIPLKGGSLRGMVQHAGGPRKVSPSVAKLIEFEMNLGVNRPEFITQFSAKLDVVKAKLGDLLSDLKTKGKSVAGYGASMGSTTMIYHWGLGDVLTFLADDDPRNQNLFSPGHHIPVLPSQALYDRKPDYVLILAWRYAEPIIKKHQAYLEQGGHFIVPMPELEVI